MKRRIKFVLMGTALLPFALGSALASTLAATSSVAASSTGASPLGECVEDTARLQSGEVFPSSEVEPWVATDPTDPERLVAAWQQDRWSNGGSRGLVTGVSTDGGESWSTPNITTYSSLCTGGTVANGADFQRATDPWVTIAPNGDVYLMSLSINDLGGPGAADHAMLVTKSTDGGLTWGAPTTLIRENDINVLNDKNSITADPNNENFVYAVWDRLVFPSEQAGGLSSENAAAFAGPALFTRSTDGGLSWEEPSVIFDQNGKITQTIGNQIVVLPDNETFDGELINGLNIRNVKSAGLVSGLNNVAVLRSDDQGVTWSGPIIVSKMLSVGVDDPFDDDIPIRTGDVVPDFAVGPSGTLYAVWQDARFNGFAYDGILFSSSTDGGLTWSDPIEVNKTPDVALPANRQAFTPSVHVLPDGTVGVSYYDFRNNGTDGSLADPLDTDYFLVHCHPTAAGDCTVPGDWTETQIAGGSFDMRQAPFAGGLFVGDYEGLTNTLDADGNPSFLAVFGRAFAPDPATVFASRVEP